MKKESKESVLHEWVMELPFTQQALLMLATRGPDGLPKETPAKLILHYLRGLVFKPAYPDFNGSDGFMNIDYGEPGKVIRDLLGEVQPDRILGWKFNKITKDFFKDVDICPLHFYMHLVHAAEVIGYKYPDDGIRELWLRFYIQACKGFHMYGESKEQLDERLKF